MPTKPSTAHLIGLAPQETNGCRSAPPPARPQSYRPVKYCTAHSVARGNHKPQHRKPTHQPGAHAPFSTFTGASSHSQRQIYQNREQQLAPARILLTGAQNHGAASFCACGLRVDGDWCHGHEPLTDAQRTRRFLLVLTCLVLCVSCLWCLRLLLEASRNYTTLSRGSKPVSRRRLRHEQVVLTQPFIGLCAR